MMGEGIEVEGPPPTPPPVDDDGSAGDVEQQQRPLGPLADFSNSDLAHKSKRKRYIVGGIVALLTVVLAVVLGVTLSSTKATEASGGSGSGSSEGSSSSAGADDTSNEYEDAFDVGDVETLDETEQGMQEVPLSDGFVAMDDTFAFTLADFQDMGAESIMVLENDTPVFDDSENLIVTQITEQATYGSCTIDFDLEYILYTPRVGEEYYVGTDQCTYEACVTDDDSGDKKECDTAVLKLVIKEGDAPPPAAPKPTLPSESISGESIELVADSEMKDAIVAIYGDTAIVGSPNYDNVKGTVLVFVKGTDGEWTRQARLEPPAEDYAEGSNFGWSVDIFEDTIIVGALGDADDVNSVYNKGKAHVFVRDGDEWSHEAKLVAPDGGNHDFLGHDVAIYGDTAVVSATWDDDNGDDSGSVYVFARDFENGEWVFVSKLLAPDGAPYDNFGNSIDIYEDTIAIGAFWDDDDGLGMDRGSVHVFVKDGEDWVYQTKLMDESGMADDRFGNLVALDGDTLVIGSRGDDDEDGRKDIGAAHIFVREGETWTQQSRLVAPDGAPGDEFGNSVAIDGDTVLVAARFDDDSGTNSGSVHVYVRDENGEWQHQTKLMAPEGEAEDFFGFSTRIYDGTIVVGSKSGEMHLFSY